MVGYIAYDSSEASIRQWHFYDNKGYHQTKDSKFAIVIDKALVFHNDKKDPWGSVVFVAAKGAWTQFYPSDSE